ncbi:MAG: acyl carrier protein [Planctomycetota bacterium]
MTRDEVVLAVKDIIETIAPDEETANLTMDERLRDQIDLDSMDFLDIVMELRKLYGVQVPEEDYKELASLTGCVDYLHPLLAEKPLHCSYSSSSPSEQTIS